jgi:hypothetical protein
MLYPVNIASDIAKLKEKKEVLLKELEEIIVKIAELEKNA